MWRTARIFFLLVLGYVLYQPSLPASAAPPVAPSTSARPSRIAESKLLKFICVVRHDGTVGCAQGSSPYSLAVPDLRVLPASEEVVVGEDFGCARTRQGGEVWCWGMNERDGAKRRNEGPPQPPARVSGLSQVVQIATGHATTCARLANGTLQCWFQMFHPYCRDPKHGMVCPSSVPRPVEGVRDAVDISGDGEELCVTFKNGTVRCWAYLPLETPFAGEGTLVPIPPVAAFHRGGAVVTKSGEVFVSPVDCTIDVAPRCGYTTSDPGWTSPQKGGDNAWVKAPSLRNVITVGGLKGVHLDGTVSEWPCVYGTGMVLPRRAPGLSGVIDASKSCVLKRDDTVLCRDESSREGAPAFTPVKF